MIRERVNWKEVAEAGRTSFNRFLELCQILGNDDQRWHMQIVPDAKGTEYLKAQYKEGEATHLAIDIVARMHEFTSSGLVELNGSAAWKFRLAKEVGIRASTAICNLLLESGLNPTSDIIKGSEGRDSYWYLVWLIYPSNHPKVNVVK